jgi:hypothetical protein
MTDAAPIDLKASHCCELRIIDPAIAHAHLPADPSMYVRTVFLPGTATVQIGEAQVVIQEGTTVAVISTDDYQLVSSVPCSKCRRWPA